MPLGCSALPRHRGTRLQRYRSPATARAMSRRSRSPPEEVDEATWNQPLEKRCSVALDEEVAKQVL